MKASTLLLLLIGICLPKIVFSQASMTAPEVVQPTCGDLMDGSITVTGSGAVDISFSIDGVVQSSGTFSDLGNGTYVIQMIVHDTISCAGCSKTVELNTAERPVPGEPVPTMPTNFCKSDGMVEIPIMGGVDPQINFNGMGFVAPMPFENLMQEVPYGYEVQNGDGTCVTTGFSVELEGLPSVMVLPATEFIKPTDCMADDGQIIVVANEDPMFPLEYSIGNDEWQTDPVFTGLKPDFYTVEARHAGLEGDGACPSNMIMDSIVTRKRPNLDSIRLTDPTDWCTKDGIIKIYGSAGEGDPTYQFTIDGGDTWQTEMEYLDLVEGEFPIMLANYDTSCIVDSGIYIMVEPIMPNLLGINTVDPSDCHASDGKIILLFEDQDGDPYGYSIRDSSYSYPDMPPPITDEVLDDPLSYNTLINMEQGPVKYWTDEDRELDFSESGSGVLAVEFYGLPQGNYEISYRRDTNVCITAHSDVDLVDPPMPSISVSEDPPINCKRQTGSISINGSGGKGSYEFTIDGGANWQNNAGIFSDLTAGSYSPIVRNADGTCPNGSGTIVFPLYPLEPTLTNVDLTHPTDCGAADGTISITATPGTSSPEYSIGGAWQASSNFTGLVQGNYTPMVRNSDGGTCAVGTTVTTLLDPPNPSFPSIASATPDNGCNQSGSITINSTGGRSPIQYSLDGGVTYQNSSTFTNLNNDTYTIYVKNTDGTCIMGPLTYTLTGPVLPIITEVRVTDPTDCNRSDGKIEVFAQGGATFEYSFDGGATFGLNSVKSGLDESDGVQHVLVRNAGGGCHTVDAGKYRVTDHIFPVLGNQPIGIIINHINACGLTNGRIEIPTLTGDKDRVFFPQGSFAAPTTSLVDDVSNYQFSIDNGATWQASGVFTDLPANTYRPIFRNSNGTCAVPQPSITITTPNPPSTVITKTSADCEASNGQIRLEITDGLGQFQARIAETGESFTSPELTPPHIFTFSNLKNQEPYTLIYESAAGNCTVSETVTLDGGSKPKNITVAVERADCMTERGSITVSATSDSHPVQYRLNGGAWQSSGVFNNLTAGNYQVEVSNNDGSCAVDMGSYEVEQIPLLSVSIPSFRSPLDCNANNGAITVWVDDVSSDFQTSIDGGLTWHPYKGFYQNLDEGVYNVRAKYIDGECEVIYGDVTLTDPAAPAINFVYRQAPANCMNNGRIIISPVTNSGFGTYEYSIDNGATWGDNREFLAVEGGTHYPSIRNKDATNTCKVDAAPITFAAASVPPTISNVSKTDPTSCMNNDGTITVTASEGIAPLEYSKDGGSTWQTSNVFMGLAGGNYAIQVASAGQQCPIDYGMVTLTSPPIVTMMHTVQQPVICVSERGSISMTAIGGSGNYSYSIDGGTTEVSTATFTNLEPGTYNIQVKDISFFCTVSAIVTLNAVPAMPSLSPTTSTHPTDCNANDGAISISATGGTGTLQYRINSTGTWTINPNFTNLAAGSYTIQVSNNDLSCPQTGETITLADPPAPSFMSATPTQATECTYEKGQITLAATGGINFLRYSIDGGSTWQIDDPVFTDLEAGVYQPRVRNSNETCIQSLPDVTINTATPPILYSGYRSKPPLCIADGEIHIKATGGSGNLEYSIDDGATWQIDSFFTGLATGTYTIKIGDRGSICEADGDAVTLSDACVCPDISVTTSDLTSCTAEDATIQIRSISNTPQFEIEYSLNGRDWGHQDRFEDLVPNITYTPSIRYANGACVVSEAVIFSRPEVPALSTPVFSHPTCENSDGQITINTTGGESELEFSINGGQNWQRSATFRNLGEGTYQLTAQNLGDNCSAAVTEVFLDMPSQPIIDTILVDPVSDCGRTDGRIELVITNADRALEYSYRTFNGIPEWLDISIFENLNERNEQVRVRNVDGTCATDVYGDLARVEAPEVPVVQRVFLNKHPSDCDASDGQLFVQAAGGSGDLAYRIVGRDWQTSSTIDTLPAGTFQVQVRNRVGGTCVVDYRETVTLVEPRRPALGSLRSFTECGTPLGTIEVRATGGQTPGAYQYTLDDQPNWSASGNLPQTAGSMHAVYIANGDRSCKTFVDSISIPDPRDVTFSLSDIDTMDATNCLRPVGSVSIMGMGRSNRAHVVSTEYEFRLNDGEWQSEFDFGNLEPANYTIEARTITGASCQSTPLSFAIAAPTVPVLTNNNQAASDCGVADGVLDLNVAVSGAVEYTINGTNEGSQSYFENKAAGDYTVAYEISSTGCRSTEVVTVPGPISPVYQDKTIRQPSDCSTTNNGQITIAAQAGSANLQYRLGTGQWKNSPTFSGLGNGNYPIQIRNQDETCVVSPETVNLQRNNESLTNVSFTSTEAACGFATGQITVLATGGNNDLEYSIGGEFQPSPNFSKLATRIYTVRVQNSNGTCQISESVMVGNNPAPSVQPADVQVQDISCNAAGRIEIPIANPSEYEFTIDGGATWQNQNIFDGLAASSNYNVGVRNGDESCEKELGSFVIDAVDAPTLSAFQATPADAGQSNGQVEINIDFGVAPYTISLFRNGVMVDGTIRQNEEDFVLSGFAAGTYEVELVDGNGCRVVDPVTVETQPIEDTICAILNLIDLGLSNSNKLRLSFVPDGDTLAFQQHLAEMGMTKDELEQKIQTLESVSYILSQDIEGFTIIDSIDLQMEDMKKDVQSWKMLAFTTIPLVGMVDVNKEYTTFNSINSESEETLSECVDQIVQELNQSEVVIEACNACITNDEATVDVKITGGIAPYTVTVYQLKEIDKGGGGKTIKVEIAKITETQGEATFSIPNLADVELLIVAQDASLEPMLASCTPRILTLSEMDFSGLGISIAPNHTLSIDDIIEKLPCTNLNDACITWSLNGGTPVEGSSFTPTTDGTITLTITKDGEVILETTIPVNTEVDEICDKVGMPCDDNDICTINDVYTETCDCVGEFQDADGDTVCDAEDQCPPIDGRINTGNDLADKDNDGIPDCIDDVDDCDLSITFFPAIPEVCDGGTVTIEIVEGYENVIWTNRFGTEIGIGNSLEIESSGVSETFNVLVLEGNCELAGAIDLIQINEPLPVNITTTNINCEVTLTANPIENGSYEWNTGGLSESINVTTTGEYSVTVTKPNGCSGVASTNVIVNNKPTFEIIADAEFACKQGLVPATPPGGGGTNGLINNSAARFNKPPNCDNTGVTLSLTPNIIAKSYEWSNGEFESSITVNRGGAYSVTISDNYGCEGTASFALEEDYCFDVVFIDAAPKLCPDQITMLSVADEFVSYQWTFEETGDEIIGNSQTLEILETGIYNVIVTEATGCQGKGIITVESTHSAINISPEFPEICLGESVELAVEGAVDTYRWLADNSTESTFMATEGGIYEVEVTIGGCTSIYSAEVAQQEIIDIAIASDKMTICNNESLNLTANTGFVSYEWSHDGNVDRADVEITASGTYSVTVTDELGCTNTGSTVITQSAETSPQVTIQADKTSICKNETISLVTVSEPLQTSLTYQWSIEGSNTSDLTINEGGDYSVTVSNDVGCTGKASISIDEFNPSDLQITPEMPIICNGVPPIVEVAGNFTSYEWKNLVTGQVVTTLEVAGTYLLKATNAAGCETSKEVNVIAHQSPALTIILPKTNLCKGETLTLAAEGDFETFTWSRPDEEAELGNSLVLSNAGIYQIEATDEMGCQVLESLTIIQTDTPTVTILPSPAKICIGGEPIQLETTVTNDNEATYQWFFEEEAITNETGEVLTTDVAGNYSYTVTNVDGCTGSATLEVQDLSDPEAIKKYFEDKGYMHIPIKVYGEATLLSPVPNSRNNTTIQDDANLDISIIADIPFNIADELFAGVENPIFEEETNKGIFVSKNENLCENPNYLSELETAFSATDFGFHAHIAKDPTNPTDPDTEATSSLYILGKTGFHTQPVPISIAHKNYAEGIVDNIKTGLVPLYSYENQDKQIVGTSIYTLMDPTIDIWERFGDVSFREYARKGTGNSILENLCTDFSDAFGISPAGKVVALTGDVALRFNGRTDVIEKNYDKRTLTGFTNKDGIWKALVKRKSGIFLGYANIYDKLEEGNFHQSSDISTTEPSLCYLGERSGTQYNVKLHNYRPNLADPISKGPFVADFATSGDLEIPALTDFEIFFGQKSIPPKDFELAQEENARFNPFGNGGVLLKVKRPNGMIDFVYGLAAGLDPDEITYHRWNCAVGDWVEYVPAGGEIETTQMPFLMAILQSMIEVATGEVVVKLELEHLQTALDVVGVIPIFGELADLTNAAIYLYQGDGTNFAISLASAVALDVIAKGGKYIIQAKQGEKIYDVVKVARGACTLGRNINITEATSRNNPNKLCKIDLQKLNELTLAAQRFGISPADATRLINRLKPPNGDEALYKLLIDKPENLKGFKVLAEVFEKGHDLVDRVWDTKLIETVTKLSNDTDFLTKFGGDATKGIADLKKMLSKNKYAPCCGRNFVTNAGWSKNAIRNRHLKSIDEYLEEAQSFVKLFKDKEGSNEIISLMKNGTEFQITSVAQTIRIVKEKGFKSADIVRFEPKLANPGSNIGQKGDILIKLTNNSDKFIELKSIYKGNLGSKISSTQFVDQFKAFLQNNGVDNFSKLEYIFDERKLLKTLKDGTKIGGNSLSNKAEALAEIKEKFQNLFAKKAKEIFESNKDLFTNVTLPDGNIINIQSWQQLEGLAKNNPDFWKSSIFDFIKIQ